MLNEEVYLGLFLELKKRVHVLPEEECCNDLPLLGSLIGTPFQLLLATRYSLEKVPCTEHKAISVLFPLTNVVAGDHKVASTYVKRDIMQSAPSRPHRCENNKVIDLH